MTQAEIEIVFLKAIKEMVDSIINHEIMDFHGGISETQIVFKTATHQKYFNIILNDFLSPADSECFVPKLDYMSALKLICDKPYFNFDFSVSLLNDATNNLSDWLDHIIEVNTWLPTISEEVEVVISRKNLIRICGNISKHNVSRSGVIAKNIQKVMKDSGKVIGKDVALLLIGEFYDKFHTDILNYHGSTITELLNEIRWGIYEYLQPELSKSRVWEGGDPPKYRYRYPKDIITEFAKSCYWDLLNEVSREPYIKRIKSVELLKKRY